MAYANFISDLLSVVFAEYTELIRLLEMECLIYVAVRQYRLLWCSGLGAGLVAYISEVRISRRTFLFILFSCKERHALKTGKHTKTGKRENDDNMR